MATYTIDYTFILPDGKQESFQLVIDTETMLAETMVEEELPEWTHLDFHQCPHCPLSAEQHRYCPLARRLRGLVSRFDDVVSHDMLKVRVMSPERTVTIETTAQRALGSFMGLLMATSDCPHMAFFKPMARFHLSFANSLETLYRAAGMFMLAQYFRHRRGESVDLDMDGLVRIYASIHLVNQYVAKRISAASESDAAINGVVLLDSFAQLMPLKIKRSLDQLEQLFRDFLPDETFTLTLPPDWERAGR